MTFILFLLSFLGLLFFEISIFNQAFYFVGFFLVYCLVFVKNVRKRFSLLPILFWLNDWFSSKLDFGEEKGPSFLIKLAFPVTVGFLILSFSKGKGALYFIGLFLGGMIHYLQVQLLAKKSK